MRKQDSPFVDGCPPCLQSAELAFTSSVSGPPRAPGVQGSQPGEAFWKVCPLQRLMPLGAVRATVPHTLRQHQFEAITDIIGLDTEYCILRRKMANVLFIISLVF